MKNPSLRLKSIGYLILTAICAVFAFRLYGAIGAILAVFILLQAAPAALGLADLSVFGAANNDLGTLAATGVFHDALGLTLKRLPFLKRMAKDVAPLMAGKQMPFNVAQILKNYNAAQLVYDRGQTGSYQVVQGIDALPDQNFTLNNWPAVSIKLSAVEVNQIIETYDNIDARAAVINKLLQRGFNALGTYIAQAYYNLFTAANFPNNYAVAIGTQTFKTLSAAVDVLLTLDALNPNQAPNVILDIAGFRELCNSLTTIYNEQIVGDAVRTGVVNGEFAGANGIARFNIPLVADSSRGFIADPLAIVMANRVPVEEMLPNDPVHIEIIEDKDTGFAVLYREAKDIGTGEVTRTITTMFGFALGLNNHAIRLTTS